MSEPWVAGQYLGSPWDCVTAQSSPQTLWFSPLHMGKCAYTARRRKGLGQNYRGNNLACAPRPAGQHRGLGCLWSGNIDLGHIASSRWPEHRFSAFATWYHGHKSGTHRQLITQFMAARCRTGPFSSLITGHSKFTPIKNTKNSCHDGIGTVVFCTRHRPANIRVIY